MDVEWRWRYRHPIPLPVVPQRLSPFSSLGSRRWWTNFESQGKRQRKRDVTMNESLSFSPVLLGTQPWRYKSEMDGETRLSPIPFSHYLSCSLGQVQILWALRLGQERRNRKEPTGWPVANRLAQEKRVNLLTDWDWVLISGQRLTAARQQPQVPTGKRIGHWPWEPILFGRDSYSWFPAKNNPQERWFEMAVEYIFQR